MKRTLHFFIVLCLVVFIGRNLNAFELVPICDDIFDQTNPAIYGDKIAWIDNWRQATFGAEYVGGEVVYKNGFKSIPSVCIYDLKSKLMSCIAVEKTPVHIAMYEDKLVLELDEGEVWHSTQKDIYMFDLKQLTFKIPSDEKSYIDSLEPTENSGFFYDRKQNIVVEVEYDKGKFERIVGVYYGDPATWHDVIYPVVI